MGLIAPAASAATPATPSPFAPPKTTAGPSQPPALTGTAKAIWDARVKAKQSGKAVTVDELTTESTETVVNPDGTLTSKAYAEAVRVKHGNAWAAIDATLRTNPDGSLSPTAVPGGLIISGGGNGPLATLTTDDGKKLAISAPFALPKPTVSGATATYTGVLPDVDLQMTALPTGGWRDVIVVRSADAAANPALKTLHFPIHTEGLKAEADSAGNLKLKDDKGDIRFNAPTPFQWDSSLAPVGRSSGSGTAFLRADAAADSVRSTTDAPGEGAKVGMMHASADSNGIDLSPDPATFGKGSGPWYLDPTVSANAPSQQSVQVQEYNPNTQYADSVSNLGSGYCAWLTGTDPCPAIGRERAYYRVSIPAAIYTQPNGAPSPPTLHDATLYTQVTSAANQSQSSPLGLYSTGSNGISSTTTWNNQPCGTGSTMQGCSQIGMNWFAGTGGLNYDVLSQMQSAEAGRWTSFTFGLAPTDEYNGNYRHHFANNPNIVINYDLQPSSWNALTTPTPGFASDASKSGGCKTPGTTNPWDNPGWVGANQNIYLHQSSWSPAGFNLDNVFHIWDDNDSTWGQQLDTGYLGSYNTDAVIGVGSLVDGHQYGWSAWSTDGWLTSPSTSPSCYFRVDKTPPVVSLSSTSFPATGTLNANPTIYAGNSGTFTVSAVDPSPPTGSASGVACIRWSDNPTPPTGWHCNDTVSTPNTGIIQGSSGNFTYTPPVWGTNHVYAQAQDNAGNYSQPAMYSFYAPWNPSTRSLPGSLTTAGMPDVLMTDSAGNLKLMHIGSNPTATQAAPLGLAPSDPTTGYRPSWNNVLTSHRGSLSANALDDVFAYSAATPGLAKNLYLYPNTSNGVFQTYAPITRPTSWYSATGASIATAPADYTSDWSKVSQILALGALNAKFSTDPSWVQSGAATLLTVENGNLWLFRSESINSLDDAIEVSNTGTWGNYDLLNPGTVSGSNQPTLWTRNRTDGSIRSYPVKVTNNSLDLSALSDPSKGTLIPGITLLPSKYPTVGAANGISAATGQVSIPGLWAFTSDPQFLAWTGQTSDGTANGSFTGFSLPTVISDLRNPVDGLPLSSIANGSTPDTLGTYPGTVKGGVATATDTVGSNGTATSTVTTFDGKLGSEVDVNNLTIDTTKSFSISMWTKPTATDGVVVSQDNTQDSGFMLWPATVSTGYAYWRFGMSTADNGGWPYDVTGNYNAAARVVLNQWVKLTVSYDETTGEMALYVNGSLAATGFHTTKLAAAGSLVIGRYKYQSLPNNPYSGSISDLRLYNFPSTPAGNGTTITSGVSSAKCIDDTGFSASAGTKVEMYDCNGSGSQQWTANDDGTLRVSSIPGLCADASGAGTANGTVIDLWYCNNGANQQWLPQADGSFYNPVSRRCLDDTGGNVNNGLQLELYDCNQSPAQRWSWRPLT